MRKQHRKLASKIVSVIMSFLFVALSIPFAFAAEQTELTESNVAVWPTFEGEMYYGQKLSEGSLTIKGGTVTTDGTTSGTVIEGYFEFVDLEYRPTSLNVGASLRFVPADSQSYTGFEVLNSLNAIYQVLPATPELVDPINDPPVATKVSEAGKRLMTTTISGGALMNPYTKEVIKDAKWAWVKRTQTVNESGYYEAASSAGSYYNKITMDVFVGIEGDTEETTVTVAPTFDGEIVYAPDLTWGDLTLVGGTAVIKSTNTPIDGTFAVADTMKDKQVKVGENTIDVKFTPADETLAMSSICQVPVTVKKGVMSFADENGNEIVPEITVPYGTKFGDIPRLLRPYISGGPDVVNVGVVGAKDTEVCKDGTYTASVVAPNDSANYERTELSFKIVIEKKVLKPVLKATEGAMLIVDSSAIYRPTGTFTLKYTIDGVEQEPLTGIKYNTAFEWNPTKSGNYEYTVIYNEAEVDEYFIIDDFVTSNPVKLIWEFSATGSVDGKYTYGDEIKLEAPETDPERADKPYYGFVKWIDNNGNTGLSDEDLENRAITFSMPDGNVDLDAAYEFDFMLCVRYYVQIIVDFFTSFFNSIGTLF